MLYNKIYRKIVLDVLDYFLISAITTSTLAWQLKKYSSERARMARLESSIIKKSRLLDPEPLKLPYKLSSKELRIKKVYMLALDIRGGIDSEYQLADRAKDIIMQLAVFLKKRELQGKILKFIFGHCRLILQFILSIYKIDLQFIVLDPPSLEIVAIACCTGGATGFVVSWLSAATTLMAPPTLLALLVVRSLGQQIRFNREYAKFIKTTGMLLKDKNFQEGIKSIIIDAQKKLDNFDSIKLGHLNWNRNPEIQIAAEQLGIFENPPLVTGQFTPDTLDPGLNKILEKFGLSKKLITKSPVKGKTINFRDFIKEIVDGHEKSGLDFIDAEILQEPIQIRIRD
jgi:hypothetical protein